MDLLTRQITNCASISSRTDQPIAKEALHSTHSLQVAYLLDTAINLELAKRRHWHKAWGFVLQAPKLSLSVCSPLFEAVKRSQLLPSGPIHSFLHTTVSTLDQLFLLDSSQLSQAEEPAKYLKSFSLSRSISSISISMAGFVELYGIETSKDKLTMRFALVDEGASIFEQHNHWKGNTGMRNRLSQARLLDVTDAGI